MSRRHRADADIAPPSLEPTAQFGDAGRFVGGPVTGLARIGGEVEQFEPAALEVFDELPVTTADRPARPPPPHAVLFVCVRGTVKKMRFVV